jgi:hypothetical protein
VALDSGARECSGTCGRLPCLGAPTLPFPAGCDV